MIGLAIVGTLTVGASPASAHTLRAYVVTGGVIRGYAEVNSTHLSFAACDTRSDGIGVYGRFKFKNGTTIDVSDANGSSSGCGSATTPSSNPVVAMQAISRDGGSSGWVTA